MKKISILTVALIAVLAIGVGTASAQTASIGYQGMLGSNMINGLSVRGWVDAIGWEGTFFYGQAEMEETYADGDPSNSIDADLWMLDIQGMFCLIAKENSKLYTGLHLSYGGWEVDPDGPGSLDDNFWAVGPMIGAQYSFQGIPELSFNWEVSYDFLFFSAEVAGDETELDINGLNTTIGVHYAF